MAEKDCSRRRYSRPHALPETATKHPLGNLGTQGQRGWNTFAHSEHAVQREEIIAFIVAEHYFILRKDVGDLL
ncbi:hypothetical protein JOE59_000912 [Agromyces cerinus]|nr:hypothetical protein [Agromyces cerinus]MBM7830207.1 hypothetical protein [Agromyces cerinus]